MSYLTVEKVCMTCGGREMKECDPGGSQIVNVQESICNICRGILMVYIEDIRNKSPVLSKSKVTFSWNQ